jgi:dihydropteroate synthase
MDGAATPGAAYAEPHDLRLRGQVLPTGSRCLVMGVVNVTPDSFSDGGRYLDPQEAIRHGLALAAEGADLLDVGGESTRPGAHPIDAETELDRVLPVVEGLRRATDVAISVDTRKAVVARAALGLGASMINDVSAGRDDPGLLPAVARAGAAIVLMHMQGTPATMQDNPSYVDVVSEVEAFLAARCAAAERAGIDRSAIVVDPGIGFGKNEAHNYALLAELRRFTRLGHPVLAGVSRKGFIGRALGGAPVDQRLEGTAAAVVWVVERGARIVRVHDVAPMRKVVRMTEALVRGSARTEAAQGR